MWPPLLVWLGWTPPTGVEAAEWLGELGRDLQDAISCCCFFSATAFWATSVKTLSTLRP